MSLERLQDGSIKLCVNKGKSCCPVIRKLDDGRYSITDDDGNTVTLTEIEIQSLSSIVSMFGS